MQAMMIKAVLHILMNVLTEDLLKNFADTVLDWIEDKVLGTASPVDDALVLPLCTLIRTTFNIPDNDA